MNATLNRLVARNLTAALVSTLLLFATAVRAVDYTWDYAPTIANEDMNWSTLTNWKTATDSVARSSLPTQPTTIRTSPP